MVGYLWDDIAYIVTNFCKPRFSIGSIHSFWAPTLPSCPPFRGMRSDSSPSRSHLAHSPPVFFFPAHQRSTPWEVTKTPWEFQDPTDGGTVSTIEVKQGVEPGTQTKRGNQSGNTCMKQNNQTPFLEGA